ncbi:MAG TPA: biotin/lipoyl-binding protein [Candidatus Paceibacterota bacterium]|nr:biotin/lipoyl-binding protein [Candidatus Paceibacterota bacterium]
MKQKLIRVLNKPTRVITVTALLAGLAGVYIYKNVGIAPVVNMELGDTKTASIFGGYRDGDEVNLAFPKGGRVNAVSVKVGDIVKKGDVLASLDAIDAQGMVNQARGALAVAQANYEKILNGATGPDIDVLKAAVVRAENNYDKTRETQEVIVKNAYFNLLNSTVQAFPANDTSDYLAPVISGTYNLGKEGTINLKFFHSTGGISFYATGMATGTGQINMINEQPIADSGLYIKFTGDKTIQYENWTITLPNKKAPNYLANYNAYQSALRVKEQMVADASAALDQAKSILAAKQAAARPEDVSIAKAGVEAASGALRVAEGAYNNNFIFAPEDGVVTVLNIKAGEIAVMNQRIISMVVKK